MKVTPTTTATELLAGKFQLTSPEGTALSESSDARVLGLTASEMLSSGYTLTAPEGFELRGRPDDGSIAMRSMTPAGMTAAGHLPLGTFGVYLACNEVTEYAEMCAREDAQA